MSDTGNEQLRELSAALLRAVRDIREHLAGPPAPDAEVRAWPLLVDGEPEGGIWCGDEDCPLMAENSEIGYFRDAAVFTLDELHEAIGEHIARRRERENDE